MSIKETKDGVVISIFVKPKSPTFKIELDGNEVIVYASEEPEKGKVNKEIMRQASKILGVKVEIISGLTSKQKTLFLKGLTKTQVEAALKNPSR